MSAPEYLICLNCESPCYLFEWEKGEPFDTLCEICGSEEPDQFLTEEEFESLAIDESVAESD